MDQDRLRKIVEALLNDNGRTPEEAELAHQKAAELMLEAGLSEEELLQDDVEMLRETLEASRREWLVAGRVMVAVARLSACRAYYEDVRHPRTGRRTDRKRVNFCGYGPDVENARWLYSHLVEEGLRLLKQSGPMERREKDDFLVAFASSLSVRMNDLADRMDVAREEQGVPDGQSLVVDRDAAVDEWMKTELGLSLASGRSVSRRGSADAFAMGREAASGVSLGRPVGQGPLALPGR